MKLIFYINTLSNGGAERVISNLATEMANRGHFCIIITSYKSAWEYSYGTDVKRLNIYENIPKNLFTRNIKIIFYLKKIIKQYKPNVIVTFMAEPNFRGIISKIGTGVKSIISVRSDPKKEYSGITIHIAKLLFNLSDHIVFQTKDAMNYFPKTIQAKSSIIYNPVQDVFFETKLHNIRSGIVTFGRIVKEKNHLMLIMAYANIASIVNDDLYIYGIGDTSHLVKLTKSLGIENRVHFPGQSTDVANILSKSRLFVLTSDFEGMPNALMEAMSVGVPCISTDCPCGGPKMLFSNDINEYLIPVGDVITLVDKMKQILCNPLEENRVAIACKKAAKKFESHIVYNEWERIIKNLSK